MFSIRPAEPADLPRIMEIYSGARVFMAAHGNPDQWGADNWPPESLILDDIMRGKSFVCVSDGSASPRVCVAGGNIVGVFFFDFGPEPEPDYRGLTGGSWLSETPYGVVHRIASDHSEKGIGTFCLRWAISRASGHLRIDTHPANYVMRALLSKLGFSECGNVMIGGTKARIAYEIADPA